jgi:hypothetical protein
MPGITSVLLGLGAASSAAGAGLSFAGAQGMSGAAGAIAQLEMQLEAQRKQAMELDARRRRLEVIRNQQQARSVALTNANSQGAALGSGLQGGYGQISGQSNNNLLGINQQLTLGENMFNINAGISQQRLDMAGYQGLMSTGQGLSSLGGAFLQAAPYVNRLSGGFGYNPFATQSQSYSTGYSEYLNRTGALY